ncbi:MAG: hypothetical protein RR732_04345, partial [Bacilli bacterium]
MKQKLTSIFIKKNKINKKNVFFNTKLLILIAIVTLFVLPGQINADKVRWSSINDNSIGPDTALNELETKTNGWSNVPSLYYTVSGLDQNGVRRFPDINRSNVKARMITYAEAVSLGCIGGANACPAWLALNLSNNNTEAAPLGYWMSTPASNGTDVWMVDYLVRAYNGHGGHTTGYGVRPVIELKKMPPPPPYKDASGANQPILKDGMIPIYFEGNTAKKADIKEKWYDYNNKEWANAVLVTNAT